MPLWDVLNIEAITASDRIISQFGDIIYLCLNEFP